MHYLRLIGRYNRLIPVKHILLFYQLHQILETKAPDEAQSGSVWRRGGPAPQPAPARGDVEGFEILKGGPAQKRPPLVVVEGGALVLPCATHS